MAPMGSREKVRRILLSPVILGIFFTVSEKRVDAVY